MSKNHIVWITNWSQLFSYSKIYFTIISHLPSNSQSKLRKTVLEIANCDFSSEEGSCILRKLLESPSLSRMSIDGPICSLPSCENQYQLCPRLVELTHTLSAIENDPMEILEKLPMLKKLELSAAFVGRKMVCHDSGFPQLRYLSLEYIHHLEEWQIDEGALPKLSNLIIYGCTKLEMIPDGLRFINTLTKLEIHDMPKFKERLQMVNGEKGQDYDKVRHISSIVL